MPRYSISDPELRSGADSGARAEHILDAAATLLLRWGYQRITMEDIARQADIGTGTLYLHWKSKAALFEAVLLRELLGIWAELEQELLVDPQSALLHRLLPAMLHAIHRRRLALALFVRDATLLGNLANTSAIRQRQPLTGTDDLIRILRDLGLARSDVREDVQAHAFSAVWTGFVLVDSILDGNDRVSLETQVAALGETVRRTFEPDVLPSLQALREQIAPALRAFLAEAQLALKQQIEARMRGVGRE